MSDAAVEFIFSEIEVSDETKIANTTWGILKKTAMKQGYKPNVSVIVRLNDFYSPNSQKKSRNKLKHL